MKRMVCMLCVLQTQCIHLNILDLGDYENDHYVYIKSFTGCYIVLKTAWLKIPLLHIILQHILAMKDIVIYILRILPKIGFHKKLKTLLNS